MKNKLYFKKIWYWYLFDYISLSVMAISLVIMIKFFSYITILFCFLIAIINFLIFDKILSFIKYSKENEMRNLAKGVIDEKYDILCPNCAFTITPIKGFPYCANCGQALDWGDK